MHFRPLLACCALAFAAAVRAETAIEITATAVPAGTTEVIFLVDTAAPPPSSAYNEPAVAAAPAPGATAKAAPAPDAAAPAAPGQRRGRRGGTGGQGAARPAFNARGSVKPEAGVAIYRVTAPAGENYRVRAIALRGEGTFPVVAASGKAAGIKVEADNISSAGLVLAEPTLQLAPATPKTVAPGAHYTLSGIVTDPGSFLGTKNRMRVWITPGQPPAANRTGTQTSTVDVTTTGDEIAFTLELVAPKETTTLYFQFGEVSDEFNREDGKQVPFLVVPDLAARATPLALRVAPAGVAATSP